MSLSAQVSVTSTPTLLTSGLRGSASLPVTITVRNTDASVSVFLGGVDVSTSNGFELVAGAAESIDLVAGDDLYARTASATVRVDVLKTRQ